jgi:hypothetical protein
MQLPTARSAAETYPEARGMDTPDDRFGSRGAVDTDRDS